MGLAKTVVCEVGLVFRQQNLERVQVALMADCHLYIVSRRPTTYLDHRRLRVRRDGSLSGKVVVERQDRRQVIRFRSPFSVGTDLTWVSGLPRDYYQLADRHTGTVALHGDPATLAYLVTGCDPELARHEVLYVGQARGSSANRTVIDRILSHETLQRIYADHAGLPYDIFVAAIRVSEASSVGLFSTAEDFDAVSSPQQIARLLAGAFGPREDKIAEQTDLAEAALIAYFQPTYNKQHLPFPASRSKIATDLDERQYTNLEVSVHDGGTGLLLHSHCRPARRIHRFSHVVPARDPANGQIREKMAAETAATLQLSWDQFEAQIMNAPRTLAVVPADVPERLARMNAPPSS